MVYKISAIALLVIEFIIGTYVHDTIIRPYIGDLLVAILIYCTFKSFVDTPFIKTVIATLLLCYAIEVSQYFNLIFHLGLQNSKAAHMLLGSSFSWIDMLCYTAGMAIIFVIENIRLRSKTKVIAS